MVIGQYILEVSIFDHSKKKKKVSIFERRGKEKYEMPGTV